MTRRDNLANEGLRDWWDSVKEFTGIGQDSMGLGKNTEKGWKPSYGKIQPKKKLPLRRPDAPQNRTYTLDSLEVHRGLIDSILVTLLEGDEADEWIGVDLDGTLAKYNGYKGATKIGEPIPAMVNRIRRWVGHGKKVKIFTARADDERSVNAIKKWLKDNELPDLEVTNLKDQHMSCFYDDRAIQVVKNKGTLA